MRVLVSGGAGYIGSIVAAQLLDAGHEVTVFDNLHTGHRRAVPQGATWVRGDLLDAHHLKRVMSAGFDGVAHLAARTLIGESVAQPELYYRNNVCGTLNLLDSMRENGVARIVLSSTAAVYGEPGSMPITEDTPVVPVTPYGASKLTVDQMVASHAKAYGLAAASLRYFNVAGASERLGEDHRPEHHLIPNVLRAAYGDQHKVEVFGTDYPTRDGTAVRDYIHVEDLARAHLLVLEGIDRGRHEVFNLGSGHGFSVKEVVEAARRVTGREIRTRIRSRRPGDPAILIASGELMQRRFDWKQEKPDLRAMIADAWTWKTRFPRGYR